MPYDALTRALSVCAALATRQLQRRDQRREALAASGTPEEEVPTESGDDKITDSQASDAEDVGVVKDNTRHL
jgi:hypothetical protein